MGQTCTVCTAQSCGGKLPSIFGSIFFNCFNVDEFLWMIFFDINKNDPEIFLQLYTSL